MQVVFHMGVHCTDEDQLIRSLQRNRGLLVERGVAVPSPGRFRQVIREAVLGLKGAEAPEEMQRTILDAVTDQEHPSRLFLSSDSFLGAASAALGGGMFYPRAEERSPWFPNIFPDADCSFMLAIRNPAAFLPSLWSRREETRFPEMLANMDPLGLRWSDLIDRLRRANPGARITVWCDEDTPLIWPEVMRAAAGVDADVPLEGGNDRLVGLLSETGMEKLETYLEAHPPLTVEHRRRIVSAFIDKFALEDALVEEFDLPDWTESYVDALSDGYEEDAARIAGMERVTFLAP